MFGGGALDVYDEASMRGMRRSLDARCGETVERAEGAGGVLINNAATASKVRSRKCR
jgi:hypothetical protein